MKYKEKVTKRSRNSPILTESLSTSQINVYQKLRKRSEYRRNSKKWQKQAESNGIHIYFSNQRKPKIKWRREIWKCRNKPIPVESSSTSQTNEYQKLRKKESYRRNRNNMNPIESISTSQINEDQQKLNTEEKY